MKPKSTSECDDGMQEYIEDIIGTAALKAPIETALSEVDRLAGDGKVAGLRIVETDKVKLDAERKEVQACLKLTNEHQASAVSMTSAQETYTIATGRRDNGDNDMGVHSGLLSLYVAVTGVDSGGE
ncbi:hypothetical protein K503DRAFT_802300 [Rhizopogon vinicolor AM-OR11-026]|uniref:Uncharacterized protein n=1 Tax=Rhizopogon vinicolor AM-OR11-026 TaxID=1314800 RepID=A0A1B7MU03_9AGAM|nr:hypothetical protein K503DRAFT_802300 [Rhizopogon vinicolor AM-OR11-026]